MTALVLQKLYHWFDSYTECFLLEYPHYHDNLKLKKEHSLRVCSIIRRLAAGTGLEGDQAASAEIAALLHDVGRFRQYAEYGTFSDAASEDHGSLSVSVIDGEGLLRECRPETRDTIRFAVQYHNKAAIPHSGDDTTLHIAKLLRDADKIDIWHVVTEHYLAGDAAGIASMLDLPDNDEISPRICDDIRAGTIARMEHLQSCNDLKLLQMAWVYDINFPESFKVIQEKGYIDILRDSLPDRPEVREIYHSIMSHVSSCTQR
ncbi:MAG TPA: HD domain-containing protein [Spirochaetota bacterium]|nr:HD domain-containing protein [Spirochaetota bacterium]